MADAELVDGRLQMATIPNLLLLVAAPLPPEPEFFLHGTVGVAEEHRVLAGFVVHGTPARHDEDVARLPLEGPAAGDRPAAALDAHVRRRLRRWLWVKHKRRDGATKRYPDEFLYGTLGLVRLSQTTCDLRWAKA